MPRIPYLPSDLAEPRELVDSIRARRGGRLLNLDRMLLYSPALARGWNGFLREVRGGLTLSPKLRELAICVVAVVTGADYEFDHHAPVFLQAGGTAAQLEAVRRIEQFADPASLFDSAERAIIRLAVEMTRQVKVSDATFSSAKAALSNEQQLVEAVGVIAAYNMVSRFLVALDIGAE